MNHNENFRSTKLAVHPRRSQIDAYFLIRHLRRVSFAGSSFSDIFVQGMRLVLYDENEAPGLVYQGKVYQESGFCYYSILSITLLLELVAMNTIIAEKKHSVPTTSPKTLQYNRLPIARNRSYAAPKHHLNRAGLRHLSATPTDLEPAT